MARDTGDNVAVDFVWGNFPMQPNDDRDTWLDPELDSHSIVTDGWSGYPDFVPNFNGVVPPIVVPDLIGLTQQQAIDAASNAGLLVVGMSGSVEGATSENDGTVKSQSVPAGTLIDPEGDRNIEFVLYSYFG